MEAILAEVPEVSNIGHYRNADQFAGYGEEPEYPYDRLHQHLLLLEERFPILERGGVDHVIVCWTILSEDPHVPTEVSKDDIARLARIKGTLAVTFNASAAPRR